MKNPIIIEDKKSKFCFEAENINYCEVLSNELVVYFNFPHCPPVSLKFEHEHEAQTAFDQFVHA